MARTKAEVRAWLNSQVGKKVNAKAGIYNGQCVSLIKALLEFLGAPNPYAARGNAKDVGDTLLRQNIAEKGDGWLRVVINRSMGNIGGVTYGHIWVDLKNETNYEQNGARALYTTKGTRPYSQRQQVVNLDKYIKAETKKPAKKSSTEVAKDIVNGKGGWGNNPTRAKKLKAAGYNPTVVQGLINKIIADKKKKPSTKKYYTVKKGDTMTGIAKKYKTTLAKLDKLNPGIKNLNEIDIGQKVRVK